MEEIKPKRGGGKHNHTSRDCIQSHSPNAKKPSGCYNRPTSNKGARETKKRVRIERVGTPNQSTLEKSYITNRFQGTT